jgi:hypothetical protein
MMASPQWLIRVSLAVLFAAAGCSSDNAGSGGSGGSGGSVGGGGSGGDGGSGGSGGDGGGGAGGVGGSGGSGGHGGHGGGGHGGGGSGGSGGGGSGGSGGSGGQGGHGGSTGGMTVNNVYITWYGFNDNSCQVESQHNCNTIAYPQSAGYQTAHEIGTEGKGTYDDPSTFATAMSDDGSSGEIPVGTIIYVPEVRKYFIMEDQCFECGQEWAQGMNWHVDLWMGPSYGSAQQQLISCEDSLTVGATNAGTGTIIIDPPADLPVDTNPLFTNDTCTAHTY